ncbi:MAG: hypothetical protein N3A58_00620 [Spirochaetes bacterium]|nr:hypothetical protein [Spirochaetota bacterium]
MRKKSVRFSKYILIFFVINFVLFSLIFTENLYCEEHFGFTIFSAFMKIGRVDSALVGIESSPFLFNSILIRASFYLNIFSFYVYKTPYSSPPYITFDTTNSYYKFMNFLSYSFDIVYKKKIHDLINIYITTGVIFASLSLDKYYDKAINYQVFDYGPLFSIGQELFFSPVSGLCVFFESGFFILKNIKFYLANFFNYPTDLGWSVLNNEYSFYNGIFLKAGIKYVF